MKVTLLGTGTPGPYARRASSGYLVATSGAKILLDCGGGVVSRLYEAGHGPDEITTLCFTHLHSDHMIDYARLIHAAWDTGGTPIDVYGPAPLAHIHDRLFGPDGALAHDLAARTGARPSQEIWNARGGTLPRPWPAPNLREIAPGDTIEGAGWRLRTCEVPHAQPHLACMGFRLEAEGKVLAYSGDAGLGDEMEALAAGADLLIHWCYRNDGQSLHPSLDAKSPTPSDIGAMARRAGVRQLLLSHIRVQVDSPAAREIALNGLSASFGPKAGIAEDLDAIML